MILIYPSKIHSHKETNEWGSDEPYILISTVDLVPATQLPIPAFEVFLYGPFEDIDDETTRAVSDFSRSFRDVTGRPKLLNNPDQVIFIASLMENDNGNPESLRTLIKGVVGTSIIGSLSLQRADRVAALINDINSALGTPTGFPNFDDVIGSSQELRFSQQELAQLAQQQPVMKVLEFHGDGGHFEITFEARAWRQSQRTSTESATPHGNITSLSRVPTSMEIWWVGIDGSIQGAYWYKGSDWEHYNNPLAPAGSASQTSGMTSVSRNPNAMEIWWVGTDGSVQGAYWYEGSKWERYTLAPAGSASQTSGMTSVSRSPSTMELWWVGTDGSVQGAYWYEGSKWKRYTLAPAGSASQTSGMTSVSRSSSTMELWWVSPEGSVEGAYWYEGSKWKRYTLAPAGSALQTAGLTSVSRISNSMEVWWIGNDSSIQGAYWYEGSDWKRYELAQTESASPTSNLTSVSRIPNGMEIWWVGTDGSIQDAFWYEGSNWKQFELAPAGSASQTGGLTSLSRLPDRMVVWWTGTNASIQEALLDD